MRRNIPVDEIDMGQVMGCQQTGFAIFTFLHLKFIFQPLFRRYVPSIAVVKGRETVQRTVP